MNQLERYEDYRFDQTPTFIRLSKKLSPNARSLYGILLGHYDFRKSAQEGAHREKHIRLMEEQSMRLCEENGVDVRRIVGWCYPSTYKLSRMLGYLKNRKPVSKATKELQGAGLLLRRGRGNFTNLYVLLVPEIVSARQLKEDYWLIVRPLSVKDFWIPDGRVKQDIERLLRYCREAERIIMENRREERKQRNQSGGEREDFFKVLDRVEQVAWEEFRRNQRERLSTGAQRECTRSRRNN